MPANGEGAAAPLSLFLSCFGFFFSLLLRIWPFAMASSWVVVIRKRMAQCSAFAVLVPLPLVGRGGGGGRRGARLCRRLRFPLPPPPPPSPQGGGRRLGRSAPSRFEAAVHAGLSQGLARAGVTLARNR